MPSEAKRSMTLVRWGLVVVGVLALGVAVGVLVATAASSLSAGGDAKNATDGDLSDWLAVGVSLVALATSIVTIFVQNAQQDRALRITSRDQLTTITLKLIDMQQELGAFEAEYLKKQAQGVADYEEYNREAGILNHKLTSLARQALALSRVDKDIGFDVEFIAIGNALMNSGDYPGANEAYCNAVARSPTPRYEAINLGVYAGALFSQGDAAAARQLYRRSLQLPDDTDINRLTHAQMYREWLNYELHDSQGPSAASEAVREEGLALVKKIQNPGLRMGWAQTFLPMPSPPAEPPASPTAR
jgi:tetratricopeptide (TPR) repeat protein